MCNNCRDCEVARKSDAYDVYEIFATHEILPDENQMSEASIQSCDCMGTLHHVISVMLLV